MENTKAKDYCILVVEDSPSMRKYIALSLKLYGYKLILAVDGMDALEKITGKKVDLIITDLNMPNMDGFELIKRIRRLEEFEKLPIIVLSSLSETYDIKESIRIGANTYILKPFNIEVIQSEVQKLIGIK